jgi:NADH-dependent peroxiredoxin subunit C
MQLGELQDHYGEFRTAGVEIVTVSMDGPEGAAEMTALTGAEFLVLADPAGTAVRDYGVFNLLGDGVAAPALFVIDGAGAIQFTYVGSHAGDRPPAEEVLRLVQEYGG